MKNPEIIKERYMKDSLNIRLGGIAANLARVASFLENKSNIKAVEPILDESKYFIEWTAFHASFETQALLSEIQPILALWQRVISKDLYHENIDNIKKKAELWSNEILLLSGLLDRN